MSDLVENPEDRISRVAAHIILQYEILTWHLAARYLQHMWD